MSLEANKALARRIWDDVFNDRNLALAKELVALDASTTKNRQESTPEDRRACAPW